MISIDKLTPREDQPVRVERQRVVITASDRRDHAALQGAHKLGLVYVRCRPDIAFF